MAFLGLIKRFTRISRINSRVRVYPTRYFQRNLSSKNGEDDMLPVLIVGAGPVGLVLSILLTKLGVECAVLDKATSFSKHPQAHFINNRSMEIFRKLDGLAEEIERSQPPVDLNVADIKPWVMHAGVAQKFLCYENRVMLLTGSRLLEVLIALFNTTLSVQNFRAAMSIQSALGLDPTVANSVGSILPTGLQKAILDDVFALGRAQLSESLLNESNPLGYQRLSRLKNIFEEGKSLQLQFPTEDLGFRYLEGTIVPDNKSEAGDPGVPSG